MRVISIATFLLSTIVIANSAFANLKEITHPTCEVTLPHMSAQTIKELMQAQGATAEMFDDSILVIMEHTKLKEKLLDKGYFPVIKTLTGSQLQHGFVDQIEDGDLVFEANYQYNKKLNQGLKNHVTCTATFGLSRSAVNNQAPAGRRYHSTNLFSKVATKTNYLINQKDYPCEDAMRKAIKDLPKCVIH